MGSANHRLEKGIFKKHTQKKTLLNYAKYITKNYRKHQKMYLGFWDRIEAQIRDSTVESQTQKGMKASDRRPDPGGKSAPS